MVGPLVVVEAHRRAEAPTHVCVATEARLRPPLFVLGQLEAFKAGDHIVSKPEVSDSRARGLLLLSGLYNLLQLDCRWWSRAGVWLNVRWQGAQG